MALRPVVVALGLFWLFLGALTAIAAPGDVRAADRQVASTIPPEPPVLRNGEFECSTGYYSTTNAAGKVIYVPNFWRLHLLAGAPKTQSTLLNFTHTCVDAKLEHIGGIDSILVEARDLESPPEPGKPFDVAFSQQVSATVGGAYSLSGWLLSLCGGSSVPSDCPADHYIAKMLGIDPTGGVNPLAESVVWVENRHNFWENDEKVGWANLFTSVVAQAPTVTVFARVDSPFQWHGNHGFVDSFSLVRSPAATLALPAAVTGTVVIVIWEAEQSPDVTAIPNGNYHLYVDVQVRPAGELAWRDVVTGHEGAGSQVFAAPCSDRAYEFRIRARSEQPEKEDGAWPNHRYPGVWSEAVPVFFHPASQPAALPAGEFRNFLPWIATFGVC
jgi:hypothetical protein